MEVQDGFIVSIFNYCDRWCERCALTSRCQLFADSARFEAESDRSLAALVNAPPHPNDVREPPPWLADAIEDMNRAAEQAIAAMPPPSPTDRIDALGEPYAEICERVRLYASRVREWWDLQHSDARPRPQDPLSVILWFSTLNSSKVFRALSGLVEFDGDREYPPDHEGSAKVALIGIDRSTVAWRELVAAGRATEEEAKPFLAELAWLRQTLEEVIPRARAFVRPGFDEPDEVMRLEASER